MTTQTPNDELDSNTAKGQARAQYESICAMLAAVNVDFDRLEELRSQRRGLVEHLEECQAAHEYHCGDDPTVGPEHDDFVSASEDLSEFDFYHGDELLDLEESAGRYEDQDDAQQAIFDDPLEVQVRSGWTNPQAELQAEEFYILLCTGGPAVRIVGELDQHGTPDRAWLEYQDWGTPWTHYFEADSDTLCEYSRHFFGG